MALLALMSLLVPLALHEFFWWACRRGRRARCYALALAEARSLGLPLVVVGAPDRGATGGYGCGDVTVDAGPSSCPHTIIADVTRGIPLPDASAVVFVSCVLEYVSDLDSAVAEILRVSGGHVHVVGVEPWCLAAWLYPRTRRVGAARALTRRIVVNDLVYHSTPYALPRGQGADWVAPLPRGRRGHLHQMPDGTWRYHVDHFDPELGGASALMHLLVDVSLLSLLRRCVDLRGETLYDGPMTLERACPKTRARRPYRAGRLGGRG